MPPVQQKMLIRFGELDPRPRWDYTQDIEGLERDFRDKKTEVKFVTIVRKAVEETTLFNPGLQHIDMARQLLNLPQTSFLGAGDVRISSFDEDVWVNIKSTSCRVAPELLRDGPSGQERIELEKRIKAAVMELLKIKK